MWLWLWLPHRNLFLSKIQSNTHNVLMLPSDLWPVWLRTFILAVNPRREGCEKENGKRTCNRHSLVATAQFTKNSPSLGIASPCPLKRVAAGNDVYTILTLFPWPQLIGPEMNIWSKHGQWHALSLQFGIGIERLLFGFWIVYVLQGRLDDVFYCDVN